MTNRKVGYILFATFTSSIGILLSIVSLCTENWIQSKGEFTIGDFSNEQLSEIKYGLFSGTFMQNMGGTKYYTLYATCSLSTNICAYLCTGTSEGRKAELDRLYRNEQVEFSCPAISRLLNQVHVNLRYAGIKEQTRTFINAGLYYSTITSLGISLIFGSIATILSIWNLIKNIKLKVFGGRGIMACNFIAFLGSVAVLPLWGTAFGTTIIRNLAILYTIQGQMRTTGWTYLGFSFWLNLPSCLLFATSIFVMYLREYMSTQNPKSEYKVENEGSARRKLIIHFNS
ncbi:hypothetical protein PPYR_11683 [Photinus pyralis]|uniref:Claudin n=2 Tax=Photinus pyralis TaxID=7054 RepID=A0A5N4AC00_PHOPY|nr:uncharacterized protein LOC116177386 [Photinus pyralis]KAB0794844.1 hypothetical protein PPYR_11683 [Photinus pyralis]